MVGGAPHLADDPLADSAPRLLDIAEARGVGTDMHIDEFLHGDHLTITAYADRVSRVAGRPGSAPRATAAGCPHCRWPSWPTSPTGSPLRGWGWSRCRSPTCTCRHDGPGRGQRAIAPISALRAGGVTVCAGADNLRDPFNPLGRADPLETAALAWLPHTRVRPVRSTWSPVMSGAYSASNRPVLPSAPEPTSSLCEAPTPSMSSPPHPPTGLSSWGGTVVARTETHREIAFSACR